MGTITVTRENIISVLHNETALLAHLAGVVGNINVDYDPDTEALTVDGVSDIDLQNTYDNFEALYTAWYADSETLDSKKTYAKRTIDRYAGNIRGKFVTTVPGQEMTYQEKAEQAADYVAASYPADTSNFPFIQAEIDATSKTKEQAADDILSQRATWITIGAAIEQHRLSGKKQVDEASTEEDVKNIVDSTIALLDAIS